MDEIDFQEAEYNAGTRLHRALNADHPTQPELRERLQLAEEYAVAVKRLLHEAAKEAE